MGIRVLSGGLFTTVQDLGRVGWQQFGFAQSGAMDARALQTANILVGNARGEAGLEIALMGPTIEFTAEGAIALTGADLQPLLGGAPMPMYRAVRVAPGDVLSFQYLQSGCRAYLAFAGGLDVPLVMGSRSTQASCALGGFQGRKLAAGDEIAFRAPAMPPDMARRTAEPAPQSKRPCSGDPGSHGKADRQRDPFRPRRADADPERAHAEPPDEDQVERDIGRIHHQLHHQRGARPPEPVKPAGDRECAQRGRCAEKSCPDIGRGLGADRLAPRKQRERQRAQWNLQRKQREANSAADHQSAQ